MKKLSKAQEMAIQEAKRDIETARKYDTLEEWLSATHRRSIEDIKARMDIYEPYRIYWEREKQGDVLCRAGKNTIEALVKMGIFSVVQYSRFRKQGVLDWVHYNEDWEA